MPNPIITTKIECIKHLTTYKKKPKVINKTITKYQPTNKWKPNKITNHTHKDYTRPSFSSIHLGNLILSELIPINHPKSNKSKKLQR